MCLLMGLCVLDVEVGRDMCGEVVWGRVCYYL